MSPPGLLLLFSLLIVVSAAFQNYKTIVVHIPVQYVEGREAENSSAQGGSVEFRATRRGPCKCEDDVCSCCTGYIMETFNQKACVNFFYDPDDFALNVGISMNDRTVYKNSISGKNPQPICVPIPRFTSFKMCVRFTNVFLVGRNIHACVDIDGMFRNSALFKMSLDCMRLGANGVALLKPEDGGGLTPDLGGEDDYDVPGEGPDYDVLEAEAAANTTASNVIVTATTPSVVKITTKPTKTNNRKPKN